MAGGTTLLVDVQRIGLSFAGPVPSTGEAEATIMPSSVISAVDLTRTYHHASAHHTGSVRCQGILPFDGSIGSSCSSIAVPPAPGPIGIAGDLGIINRGDVHQWRFELISPTAAVVERFGTPTPIAPPGCGAFFTAYIVEYL